MPKSKKERGVRAATLADVGRLAGVSAMAASAVLNQARTSSRISDETRQRIIKAAAQLEYRPNVAARALANRRMQTIGVASVIEGGELNHYFLEVFNGIVAAAATHEQNTTVFALHSWGPDDLARLRALCDGRIDGLVLVGPKYSPKEKALPAHTPFVSIHSNEQLPNVINIESDEERGAFEMVRTLIADGHRRIMHLAGPAVLVGAQRRLRGYKRALASARISFSADLVVPTGYSAPLGRDGLRQWLHAHVGERLPQAIFAANDSVAVGAMEALAEAGLRVPEDVSLAGFDDSLAARITVPQITSVRQPLRAMGARAVELLLGRIEQRIPADAPPVIFPVDVVRRASTCPPANADRIVPEIT